MFNDWLNIGVGIAQIAGMIVRTTEIPGQTGDQKKQNALNLILAIVTGAISAVASTPVPKDAGTESKIGALAGPIMDNTVAMLNAAGELKPQAQ